MRFLCLFLLSLGFNLSALSAPEDFPVKGEVRTRVDFWKRVYTEVTSQQGFIHDAKDLSFIYKSLDLPANRRSRIRIVKREKKKIIRHLRSILKKDFKDLNEEETRIISLVEEKTASKIKSMIKNIRFQGGLKDRYYQGLIRSYKYMDYIKSTFKKYGLPDELVYLPHVESSFNYKAYSKVGAAGIWQFMRATARRFKLKVSYIIDDRRDPLKATVAAAKLLQANYKKLESWPLALTAYNHGARSMERAVAKVGTKDIEQIIKNYKGRRFGFASKNFYATFMATVELSQNPTKYFPTFTKPAKFEYSLLKLDRSYLIDHIAEATGIDKVILREYNPSIRSTAFKSALFIPKGTKIQLPKTNSEKLLEYASNLAQLKLPKSEMELDKLHIVSRGESLFTISQLYKVQIGKIIQFNQISDPRRIYPGMKLKIPGKKTKLPPKVAAVKIETPPPAPVKTSPQPPVNYEIKPAPVKKPKTPKISFANRVKNFVSGLFKEEEPQPYALQVAKEQESEREQLLNLSSYLLDLNYIAPDIYEITVETEETLGHFAEWAKVPTQTIRNLNGLGNRSNIQMGQKLKIKIFTEQLNFFKELRNEYHLSIQEDFYSNYRVETVERYAVRAGDNLSALLRRYELPYWLLRKNQIDGILKANLRVGDIINIPKIADIEEQSTLKPTEEEAAN